MKKIITLVFSLLALFGYQQTATKNETKGLDKKSCFTASNFDTVYTYIAIQIKNGNNSYFNLDGYEIYLTDESNIAVKKEKKYTVGTINKSKGIFSLAIMQKNNEKTVLKINELYCKILSVAENKTNNK